MNRAENHLNDTQSGASGSGGVVVGSNYMGSTIDFSVDTPGVGFSVMLTNTNLFGLRQPATEARKACP